MKAKIHCISWTSRGDWGTFGHGAQSAVSYKNLNFKVFAPILFLKVGNKHPPDKIFVSCV